MTNHEYLNLYDLTVPPKGITSVPKSLDVALTGRCNLSCQYCYYSASMESREDLPTERWLHFFSEIGDLGVQRVCLTGGEVFLRSDLFTLIDGIIENRMRYSIQSNGTLITDRIIFAFSQGKRTLRLDNIQISIDGSCAEIHNLSRPDNSFNNAIHGLQLLQRAGIPVKVRVTINKHNIEDLENIAKLLFDELNITGFSTNEVESMGTARSQGEKITLTTEERKHAMMILQDLNKKYGGRISAQAGPLYFAQMLKDIDNRISNGEDGINGRGVFSSCGCVFHRMAVLHDGTMIPCTMLPTLVMGVIGMHSLKDLWLTSPAINTVRLRRNIPLSIIPECKECRYIDFCTGGCPASVMAKTGRLMGIDPLSCYNEYKKEA